MPSPNQRQTNNMNPIAISNIAWDIAIESQVIELLKCYQISQIDIAPSKYFSDFNKVTESEMSKVRESWNQQGFELVGMQALLFGTQGLNVFGDTVVQREMLEHLTVVCRIAKHLGITKLVFGSPKNRDIQGLTAEQVRSISYEFFNRLGDIAERVDCMVCLEPNPTCYGANFMTNSLETLDVVKWVNHSAIKMQLDLGAVSINQENIDEILGYASAYIGHIHISEPELDIIGTSQTPHDQYAAALAKYLPNRTTCIEMLPAKNMPVLEGIEQALQVVMREYV